MYSGGGPDHSNPFLSSSEGDGDDNSNPFRQGPANPFHTIDTGAHFGTNEERYSHMDDSSVIPLHEEVVPAVVVDPGPPTSTHAREVGHAPSAWGAASHQAAQGTWSDGQVPAVADMPFTQSDLAFTESTVVPIGVTGKIGASEGNKRPAGGFGGAASRPEQGGSDPLLSASDDPSKYAFWNLRRYRPYFNVNTEEVMWRVGNSMMGALRPNFMEFTHGTPDLYGPFWVATTLVFVTAVSGNFSSYLAYMKHKRNGDDASSSTDVPQQWFADSTKMVASAGLFYGYVFIIGFMLWAILKYFRGDLKLANIFCIYGYSLSIFIPVSLLCILPYNAVRWLLVIAATLMSGGFLFMNFQKAVTDAAASQSVPLLGLIIACHVGLGLGLQLYFFNY